MSAAPPGAAHFARPADVADHVATRPAVIVVGPDPQHAASLAVAIARATAGTGRRVALGDLAGDLGAIYSLAGGEDATGLAECFRDGLTLNDIARPVPDVPTLFVLPGGADVRGEPALASVDRWQRLIGGFGEAGGLLILVVSERSPLVGVLGSAGAAMLYAGPGASAPAGAPLVATIGAALSAPPRRTTAGGVRGWQAVAAVVGAAGLCGGAAVVWTRTTHAPNGSVVLAPMRRMSSAPDTARAGPTTDTVSIVERATDADRNHGAPFAIEVVAANTASNANSLLRDAAKRATLPAATVSVVAVRSGSQRTARWHKVMFGAWRSATEADSALTAIRGRGVVERNGGVVVRAPFAVLLADSAAAERARAVMDVWRAKGVSPYALRQDDGTTRVYAGAFETVAQAVTMAAMVRAAGGAPIVALRTGRPD